MTDQGAIVATASNSLFRRECSVTADIASTPELIWQLLTDVDERYATDLKAEAEQRP